MSERKKLLPDSAASETTPPLEENRDIFSPENQNSPEADADSADAHTRAVSDMFGRLTPWYDLQNHAFSLGLDFWWRRHLVRAIVPGPTRRVLDLAAGTLDVSIALCRRHPGLSVVAADICGPMLDFGMERKAKGPLKERISPLVADARCLPLPDASFDAVTMAFGIRNVRPRADALKEMHRVLVPGGRACVLEFAPVETPLFGPFYHWYLRVIMPRLAGLICSYPEAYAFLADTVENFPRPADFSEELREAGFPFVRCTSLTFGVVNLHVAVKGI